MTKVAWTRQPSLEERRGDSDDKRPEVEICAGQSPAICRALAQAFLDGEAPIYRRGSMLMRAMRVDASEIHDGILRARDSLILVRSTPNTLRADAAIYANLVKWVAKKKCWVSVDLPERIARTFIELASEISELRTVVGISEAPIIRCDGTLSTESGYDEHTGLIFDQEGLDWSKLSVPKYPTQQEAKSAVERLREPIKDFPYVAETDLAVALSAIVSAILRPQLSAVPLHGISAFAPGTGKTLLADVIGIIATGRAVPGMAQGESNEEFEKRINSALLAGDAVANIDNVSRPIYGDTVCINLTASRARIRPLGRTEIIEIPTATFWMATGNNLTFKGDMVRRALICRMDAGMERPDLRQDFAIHDLRDWVMEHRLELLSAVYTLLRAYIKAGSPVSEMTPLGSFEEWSRRVRDPLMWLGLPDPVGSMESVREEDPDAEQRIAVLEAWRSVFGADEVLVSNITQLHARVQSLDHTTLPVEEALIGVLAGVCKRGRYDANALSYWLRANKGVIHGGLRLQNKSHRSGSSLWWVEDLRRA